MRKLFIGTLLSLSLVTGCGVGYPGAPRTMSLETKQSFFASLNVASDGTLHRGQSQLFSDQEFAEADANHDGRVSEAEMTQFFATQNDPGVNVSAVPLDPAELAAIGLGGGILAGYLSFTGSKVAKQLVHPAKVAGQAGNGTFTSDNLSLSYVYMKAATPTDKAIVLCHDLGSSKEAMSEYAGFLKNYNVLAFDFRNHGASQGSVTSGGALEAHDVLAAVAFLKAQQNAHIAVLGRGMGAVAALDAAAGSSDIAAVVADDAYGTLSDKLSSIVKQHHFPLASTVASAAGLFVHYYTKTKAGDGDAMNAVSNLNCPTYYIQDPADKTIPSSTAQSLCGAMKIGDKDFWTGSHQGDAPDYEQNVLAFLDHNMGALIAPPTAPSAR